MSTPPAPDVRFRSAMPPASAPLDEARRARGRRLAIASHPAGMTFRMVFTQHLPTLALVALGASEWLVGLQSAFVFGFIALQLPTLRLVGWASKRSILVTAHVVAVVSALPLVFWGPLARLPGDAPVAVAMASFALVAAAVCVGETVWFPLLRAYVEPARIGGFFGVLRTGWHLTLIVFYAGSQWWLARHPGSFGPLFALGFALGALRTFLIVRMPERDERGQRIRAREALALLRQPPMRAYLATVSWEHAVRAAAIPFAIVMLRRVHDLSAGEVLQTTIAHFTGGLVSLIAWGRVVDRVGAVPVLRTCVVGQAVLLAGVAAMEGTVGLPMAVGWFFALSVLASGAGVADTHLMFGLAPPEAPTRALVLGAVVVGVSSGAAPLIAGAVLDAALGGSAGPGRDVYRAFFAVLGLLALGPLLPLRGVRPGSAH